MDATPFLVEIGRALRESGLEALLIGNGAAALQVTPVTTVDFDFLFCKTRRNLEKLKSIADALGATVLRPSYPVSDEAGGQDSRRSAAKMNARSSR